MLMLATVTVTTLPIDRIKTGRTSLAFWPGAQGLPVVALTLGPVLTVTGWGGLNSVSQASPTQLVFKSCQSASFR